MINTLDGITILRFAKAFKSGGGIEQYLNDLDQILLTRNKATVIRMYLEKESKIGETTTKKIGQGSLVEFPMTVCVGAKQSSVDNQKTRQSKFSFFKAILQELIVYNPYKQSKLFFLKAMFWELIVYNPFMYHAFFQWVLRRYYPRSGLFEVRNAGEEVRKIFQEYNVDLLVMHHIGTVDSAEIIEEAGKRGIPYIFINHFSNAHFTHFSIRDQISNAACIAGVSDFEVPRRLKDRFCNLSDGIDMEVFSPERVRTTKIQTDIPIIIYPARITRNKGQGDLIKAYSKLNNEGLRAKIVFAGRTDSAEYEVELKALARKNGLTDDVLFVGQLNTEELRDWYGISSVMAFPTYHQEGLGRILVEAQAMKVPPVAYIIGGTPEGIQHGKTGFLVRKGDIQAFTERLRELLTDETKRKTMGEEGRRFVQENFSLKALADRHEKYYLRVLNKARNRASQ